MKKLVILPTYNEAENIAKVINKVPFDFDILVIDDNSPDGTAAIVSKIKQTRSGLNILMNRNKIGLGRTYIMGFKWAIDNGYEAAIQMDADLSHDPKYLLDLTAGIEKGGFVVGSRYVEGGGIVNWDKKRRAVSKFGNIYSELVLQTKIRDLTGGYNVWPINILKRINLDKIRSNGYSFQIEMKYRALKQGFSFIEKPIIFLEREGGQSKFSRSIALEAAWRVWWLKFWA